MVFLRPRLSKAQTASIPFIRSALARGVGATKLYDTLRLAGAGVRKTWLLDAYKQYGGIQQSGYAVQNIRHSYFPDYERLALSGTDTLRKYSFNVGISWHGKYAEDGMTKIYESVWVTSNEKHPVQWYLDKAGDYVGETQENASADEADYVEPFVLEAQQRNPVFQ